jgi:hypothetical protein
MGQFEKLHNDEEQSQPSCLGAVSCCTDLQWSLYKQVVTLTEKVKQLEFMIENGLSHEDLNNDILMPHEL